MAAPRSDNVPHPTDIVQRRAGNTAAVPGAPRH